MKVDGSKANLAPSKLITSIEEMKALANPQAIRIFKEYSTPSCPIDIANRLQIHEQKVYYYTKRFKRLGLLKEIKSEQRHGTVARFYEATLNSFSFMLSQKYEPLGIRNPLHSIYLEPFITNGAMTSRIIVGSPDPHGPLNLRASDGCCAIDLALFLGSFLGRMEGLNYKLDIEVRSSDLKNNLILIGGPSVNMITRKANKMLPVFISTKSSPVIYSKTTGKKYSEDGDGVVVIANSPFSKKHRIMILAGIRFQGTRAAVISIITDLDRIFGGRAADSPIHKVVRGKDANGDGIIDSFEILE